MKGAAGDAISAHFNSGPQVIETVDFLEARKLLRDTIFACLQSNKEPITKAKNFHREEIEINSTSKVLTLEQSMWLKIDYYSRNNKYLMAKINSLEKAEQEKKRLEKLKIERCNLHDFTLPSMTGPLKFQRQMA